MRIERKHFPCQEIKMRQPPCNTFYRLVIASLLLFHFVSPSHGFFFPKNFFRKSPPTENPPSYHPPPQQHPRILGNGGGQQFFGGSEQLQGSGTDVQPAIRIVNRPPPPRFNDQQQEASGAPPGSNFHVPRELCLACGAVQWIPVAGGAGGEKPSASVATPSFSHGPQTQQPYQQQKSQFTSQESQPSKTIVINALGEAQGPLPLPPSIPSRRPFAIQFDANHSGNKVNYQETPKPQQESAPPTAPDNLSQGKQNRPVTFQIFQAETPRPATVLQQSSQVSQSIGVESQPPTGQEYGQPTILHPQNVPPKHPLAEKPNVQVQGNSNNAIPPPNPMTVGTIIATQQNNDNNVRQPEFQKIQPAKLVYQEHFTSQSPPSAQNFKVPILPNPAPNGHDSKPNNNGYIQNNNIAPVQQVPQHNSGPPPPPGIFLQMRPPAPFNIPPPRPSTNMKPPGPMIHYGKPVHIPNNVGPQRPSGQMMFPPPPGFFQMSPPPPPRGNLNEQQQQPNLLYGVNRPNQNGLESGIRFHEERRPSPSGQILNVQLPHNNLQYQPPQGIANNFIRAMPFPGQPPNQFPNQHNQVQNNNVDQRRPDSQGATFTQETGWEIIPSIQTDLTHLFTPGKDTQNNQGNNQLPVPVPIPVPQSNPPKPPAFIFTGANQQPQDDTQIKVQDVTYHEEARNPPNDGQQKPNTNDNANQLTSSNNNLEGQQNSPQPNYESLNENKINVNTQQGNYGNQGQPQIFSPPRPFILGVPPIRQVMFPPPMPQPFQPNLSPSIMTDLNHAQQTSLLTHQYLSQTNGVGPVRENAIFVRPVVSAILNTQYGNQPQYQQGSIVSNLLRQPVDQGRFQETHVNQGGIDPRIPSNGLASQDYNNYNCQSSQQLQLNEQQNLEQGATNANANQVRQELTGSDEIKLGGSGTNNVDEGEESLTQDSTAEQPTSQTFLEHQSSPIPPSPTPPGVRGSINIHDNGNKGSYFLYYPRPVSKSPVYWVQPSKTTSQGVVRLAPQLNPTSPSMTSSIVTWSRPRVVVANQFRTDYRGMQQQQQVNNNEGESTQETHEESSAGRFEPVESEQEVTSDEENIPYGQKLGVSRDKGEGRTPFDIITVSGSDEIPQSLEDTNEHSDNAQSPEELGKEQVNESEYGNGDPTGKYTSGTGDDAGEYNQENEGESEGELGLQNVQQGNNLNNFENDDSDDEREDYGLRPQTTFRKPISTTVIHAPGASSFQSMKLPNFKPHRVIVHDFTSHSANAAATGPSGADNSESQSQVIASSKSPASIWDQRERVKAPKYVENDEDEDSSESINRPQGLNIQQVISAGPVATADCVTTTHTGHSLSSISSTTSPRLADLQGISASKGREIYLPLGSRFPGGRPSIFSPFRGPISASLPVTVFPTSTSSYPTTIANEEAQAIGNGNRERHHFGQTLSGFAASIPVPVYRRPISITHDSRESQAQDETKDNNHADIATYIRPQANVLVAEDIYRESEGKAENAVGNIRNGDSSFVEASTTTPSSSVEAETIDSSDVVMSTEKSSSFSVSVSDDNKRERGGSWGFINNQDERVEPAEGNELKQGGRSRKVKVVQVTSVPVVTEAEPTTGFPSEGATSTTAVPSPASTSTKIVKTVRVRQRMRSGSFNGPLRNRFHGAGRVRVVHRPATQEYIRHFPEFATQEGDKLAKEEEQEVKNALIELKKSPESIKTH